MSNHHDEQPVLPITAADPSAYSRPREVAAILEADTSALGEIYAYKLRGLTPTEAGKERGTTSAPVASYYKKIDLLLNGGTVNAPIVANQHAATIREWLRTKSMSANLRADLEAQEQQLAVIAADRDAVRAEEDEAVAKTAQAEGLYGPGVYVYTLPHYIRYPSDPKTGRTLLKVGHSAKSALYRAGSQARSTELPEDPWLLRIYPSDESSEVEKKFHDTLRAFDHHGARGGRNGTEWFLTSVKALDHVAELLGLEVIEVNDFEILDD